MRTEINKQQGFTLTELIISVGLGIFLSASLTQIYLSSSKTDALVQQQSLIQENARFAFRFMADTVMHAGFSRDIRGQSLAGDKTNIPFNRLGIIFKEADHLLVGFDDSEEGPGGAKEDSDQLFIRYQGVFAGSGEDAPLTDCLGVALTDKEIVQIRYYLGKQSKSGSLLCASFIEGRKKAYQAQPLIDNVKDLQFQYGLDLNNDGSANIYVSASNKLLNGKEKNWQKVAVVKILLTLASSDGKLEKTFSEIIHLRNRKV